MTDPEKSEGSKDKTKVKLTKMRNGAPGNDGVHLIAVNTMNKECRQRLFEMLMQLMNMEPKSWPEEMKERWVIPLCKGKGPRDDINNYRDIRLIPL